MVNIKRKIVQHGPSTLIISLPSNWVKQNGVRKGDELDVREEGKTLVVSVDRISTKHSLTADISKVNPVLVTKFLAIVYQAGYDKVQLNYNGHNNIELLKAIKEKILELIGYEIIEQNDKYCLIQSISGNIELDFDNSLRKTFLILKQMIEIMYEAFKNGDKATLESLYLKDIEINRFSFFCIRQINKEQYLPAEQAQKNHFLSYFLENLEDIGDHIKLLAKNLANIKKREKDILGLIKMLVELYEVSYSYFYKASVERANEIYRLYTDIDAKMSPLFETNLGTQEIQAIFKIKYCSRLLYVSSVSRFDHLKDGK